MNKTLAGVFLLTAAFASTAQNAPRDEEKIVAPVVAMSPVKAGQGYATDSTMHYVSDTAMITAYDANWKMVWQNTTPFADMFTKDDSPLLHKHVGDIDAFNGKIYAPVESYHSCDDNTLQKIAVYSAKDGTFESFSDVSPFKHEISSVTVVPSTQSMYVTSFCESFEIPHYDLKSMQPLAPLKLDMAIPHMQGISWSEKRKMFAVTSDSPAQKYGYVWNVTPEGHVTLLHTSRNTGEMEGVDYTQDQIRYLLHHVWSLDPAIGRDVKTPPAGWDWNMATTGELSAKQQESFKKIAGDLAQVERYRHENDDLAEMKPEKDRVVFYGDSITDIWGHKFAANFFPGKNYINRGISGQTTAQMLIRFRQDVIDLHPAVVLLLAGTNDIAGNIGPSSLKMAADNIQSMAELARANGIRIVLCSTPPSTGFKWRPDVQPAGYIRQFNIWMKGYAAAHDLVYVDYYTALTDADGGMKAGTAKDGVHPTAEGYDLMSPLAEAGIREAMKRKLK